MRGCGTTLMLAEKVLDVFRDVVNFLACFSFAQTAFDRLLKFFIVLSVMLWTRLTRRSSKPACCHEIGLAHL